MAVSREFVIQNKIGLHARPASLFVKAASGFAAQITLENLSKGRKPVNAKSIMGLLTAAARANDRIRLTADGSDEEAAIKALSELIDNRFGETE